MVRSHVNDSLDDASSQFHNMVCTEVIMVKLFRQLPSQAIGLKSIDERVNAHSCKRADARKEMENCCENLCSYFEGKNAGKDCRSQLGCSLHAQGVPRACCNRDDHRTPDA